MLETWKAIVGFDGYEVSDLGRVRSLDRIVQGPKKKVTMHGRVLRQHRDSDGYQRVILIRDGKRHWLSVHRAVLNAFVGPQPDLVCRHRDRTPANNILSNLRWGTQTENQHDRIAHGTSNHGEKNGCAFLKEEEVLQIRERRAAGESIVVLATDFNVTPTLINKIATGQIWPGVGGPIIGTWEICINRKLTAADVISIRERRAAGEQIVPLGKEFNMNHSAIAGICLGKTWKHVGGPLTRRQTKRPRAA